MDIFNNPIINQMIFYPRQAPKGVGLLDGAVDGVIAVDGAELGYRFYPSGQPAVLLYFHGNGEIVHDHDMSAHSYRQAGASLLVVDYRGYGWSTGKPTVGTLLPDAEAVVEAVPGILKENNLPNANLFVMGRSLGSLTAVHVAHQFSERFKGLIIESGIANSKTIMMRLLGLPAHALDAIKDPMDNVRKIEQTDLPLLVIHGEEDSLIPVSNAQALFDASPAEGKSLLRVPKAGHNDLLYHAADAYFAAIEMLLRQNTDS